MKRILQALFLFLVACPAGAAPIIREPGVIYLSDFDLKPVELRLTGPAPCTFDVAGKRFAGTLKFPQVVKLEAVAPNGFYRVRGNAQQGGIVAWAPPQLFEPLPEKFVENLRKSEERRQKVEALIAQNEVAIGMTPQEVLRSLGKPQKKTSRATKEGAQQVWEYIKYELVPQTTYVPVYNQTVVKYPRQTNCPSPTVVQGSGGYAPSTIYVKVPSGTLSVSFKENLVEALDQSEGTTAGGQVSVVIPPVNVYW